MKRVLLALAIAALALPTGAAAQISDGDQLTVSYQGSGAWYGPSGRRVALPFYRFAIQDMPGPGGMYWDFLCIDAAHYVQGGSYNALFTSVSAGSSFMGTRMGSLGSTDALRTYRITSYLYDQIGAASAAGNNNRVYDLQRAAWFATTGSSPGMYGWSEGMGVENPEYLAAVAAVERGEWTGQGYFVVTHTLGNGTMGAGQEFLVRVPVPEPGTMALFGSGLMGLLGAGVRRRRAQSVTA